MQYVLNENNPIEKYFEEISRIPRESGHEQAVADYVASFAEEHHLKFHRDETGNVIVFKDASPGYGNAEAVILQAHMDMVCIKETGSSHNFRNDPLDLYVEDGKVYAKGTSLGADDGYGCAYMLAVLADDTLCHPALECVFTVQEETNCIGAKELDKSLLSGKYYIGLDCSEEYRPYVSSFCSDRIILKKRVKQTRSNSTCIELHLHDLNGNVLKGVTNQECGNAVKIIARILKKLVYYGFPISIGEWNGGRFENHVPTECEVVFPVKHMFLEEVKNLIRGIYREIVNEYGRDAYSGVLDINVFEYKGHMMDKKDSMDLINLIYLLPNNMLTASADTNELVALNNIGILHANEGKIELVMSSRCRYRSCAEEIASHIRTLALIYEFDVNVEERYSSWAYRNASRLRDTMNRILQEEMNRDYEKAVCPGGLEIGFFTEAIQDLDAVMLGCDHRYLHTTEEYLDLASFNRSYNRLIRLLERMK